MTGATAERRTEGDFDWRRKRGLLERSLEDLARSTDEQLKDAKYREFLDACSRFWRYSLFNQWLIHLQRPDATQVAARSVWASLGRRVRQGQTPILVLAPARSRRAGFVSVPVFDVAQTWTRRKGWAPESLTGPAPRLPDVERAARILGLQVFDVPRLWARQGGFEARLVAPSRVEVSDGLGPAGRLPALLHEYGHFVLGHLGLRLPKGVEEAEAEAVSFVVSKALGMQSVAPAYIPFAHGTVEDLRISRQRIVEAARVVLRAVEGKGTARRVLAGFRCPDCGEALPGPRQTCRCLVRGWAALGMYGTVAPPLRRGEEGRGISWGL